VALEDRDAVDDHLEGVTLFRFGAPLRLWCVGELHRGHVGLIDVRVGNDLPDILLGNRCASDLDGYLQRLGGRGHDYLLAMQITSTLQSPEARARLVRCAARAGSNGWIEIRGRHLEADLTAHTSPVLEKHRVFLTDRGDDALEGEAAPREDRLGW